LGHPWGGARFASPDTNVHDGTGPRNLEHLLW
jgi:hypothetical protein